MNSILVDTSIWIDFFSQRPKLPEFQLERLRNHILEDEVVLIEPIRVELLSGYIRVDKNKEVGRLFDALRKIDLDWNQKENWNKLIDLGGLAKSNKTPVPGVIDRMILLSAKEGSAVLWTSDRSLVKLASFAQVETF